MSPIIKSCASRKFLKNYANKVKDHYLMNADQYKEKQNYEKMFAMFDADWSGALDSQELTILYN